MKTTAIKLTKTKDDEAHTCYEWTFTLKGERFGGYCRTKPEARSDAERVLELHMDGLSEVEAKEILFSLMTEAAK